MCAIFALDSIRTSFCEGFSPKFLPPAWRIEPEDVATAISSLLSAAHPPERIVMHAPHKVRNAIHNFYFRTERFLKMKPRHAAP